MAFLTIIVFALGSCEFIWDAGNRGSLKKDVNELMRTDGAMQQDIDCHMSGTSRTGTCEGRITYEEITKIISTLKLTRVTDNTPTDYEYSSWVKDGKCSSRQNLELRYKSKRRAPELRLKSGSAFEYFLLFYNPEMNETCIQVSYAYG